MSALAWGGLEQRMQDHELLAITSAVLLAGKYSTDWRAAIGDADQLIVEIKNREAWRAGVQSRGEVRRVQKALRAAHEALKRTPGGDPRTPQEIQATEDALGE